MLVKSTIATRYKHQSQTGKSIYKMANTNQIPVHLFLSAF